MWEAIRSNKRKSLLLLFNMAFVLLALGFLIGVGISALWNVKPYANLPSSSSQHYRLPTAEAEPGAPPTREEFLRNPRLWFNLSGGFIGMSVAAVIWFFMMLTAYYKGDSILLASNRARPIEKQDHPQLFNIVEEMAIAAGLSTPPRVYIIEDQSLNAFATGRSPEHATIAVTSGLLGRLNRDQLQGVVAHEMSHILNRDILFMTLMGVMVGSIVLISDLFLRGVYHGRVSDDEGKLGILLFVVALLFALVAPFLAQVIYFASSRRREYLADASAVVLTRYPEGLASALQTISDDEHPMTCVNKVTAPMYIDNPFKGKRSFFSGLTSTHPPIEERIQILRSIGGAVSYGAYQAAWQRVGGKREALPPSVLAGDRPLDAREATPEPEISHRDQMRQATDLLRKANDYLFLGCVCGLRIKLPREFKQDHLECPRCHREVAVPVAQLAAAQQVAEALSAPSVSGTPPAIPAPTLQAPPLEITHDDTKWMTFQCRCGHNISLSPGFGAPQVRCPKCASAIRVRHAAAV